MRLFVLCFEGQSISNIETAPTEDVKQLLNIQFIHRLKQLQTVVFNERGLSGFFFDSQYF